MNAVEIEEAVSALAAAPFDGETFPFAFLEAFGNKATTIKRLRSGDSNQSDLPGGVLQRNNIHILVCPVGQVGAGLESLRRSGATARQKAKFILATDGVSLEAEDLVNGETIACEYPAFGDHFGFFLPLAGITTVRQIRESAFDIKATGRLNRLYVELLRINPDWTREDLREQMNHFMARLIFCFFAEDTGIFPEGLFTQTVAQMSAGDGADVHEILAELFRAMGTAIAERGEMRRWAAQFPYVNGGLFSDDLGAVPVFSKVARSYLIHVGNLDWRQVNPDIFGSMIQAVADEAERGALGMHYTSVPNILKVLNPLFLDDLREQLAAAGDNGRKLLALRRRLARIRVFDPACGSGNFLVIAYKEMRAIEAEVNRRRGEGGRRSEIPLSNFRGIEIRHFAAEIARLALVIAKYQCDVVHLGQLEARTLFLPLERDNWIICGNALRLDWLKVCPPTGVVAAVEGEGLDLWGEFEEQEGVGFENEGGEVFICGNPPYKGSQTQTKEQKEDLDYVFTPYNVSSKQIDYVGGWFMKAATYLENSGLESDAAFVSTNSICQGRIVPILWPKIFETGSIIRFAYTSFKWSNLASYNAGVTVSIICISRSNIKQRFIFDVDKENSVSLREVKSITPYLTTGENVFVQSQNQSISGLHEMSFGNMPVDGGSLLLSDSELKQLNLSQEEKDTFIRRIYGSAEFIRGLVRYCLWIEDEDLQKACEIEGIRNRIDRVKEMRSKSKDAGTRKMANRPHQMREMNIGRYLTITVPRTSSENRPYLPNGLIDNRSTVTTEAFALYDAPLWNMAIIASRLHLVWIATVCGKLETRYRYSNTLGWNTFPVPLLTPQNKLDLTHSAEAILLARESYFPATIADMYDPERMDTEFPRVRQAHDRNDEILERIYIGRRFKNDTERLEKLFDLYTKMTSKPETAKKARKATTQDN